MDAGGTAQNKDDALMEVLGTALGAADRVPPEVVAAAKAAWTWRTIDAELAALAYDSAVDEDALADVRGPGTVRALSFEASGLLIEIEVVEDGDRRSITGQVVPAPAGGTSTLSIEWVDRPAVTVPVDHLGRFSVERVPAGVVRLGVGGPHERATITAWVPI